MQSSKTKMHFFVDLNGSGTCALQEEACATETMLRSEMCHEHPDHESPYNMDGSVKSTDPKLDKGIFFVKIIVIFVNYCTFPVVILVLYPSPCFKPSPQSAVRSPQSLFNTYRVSVMICCDTSGHVKFQP